MSYEKFVGIVKEEVEQLVGKDMRVELLTTKKNNGKEKIGLLLKEEGINVAPTIYLEDYYQIWKRGESISSIGKNIKQLHETLRYNQTLDVTQFHDYELIKPKLAIKLISLEKNSELLEDTPYIEYIDLAIVFYLFINMNEYGSSTMLIKNVHQELWGITLEQLHKDALENAEIILPSSFQTMHAVMQEMLYESEFTEWEDDDEKVKKNEFMYVLSNKHRHFGAACILYKNELERIGDILKENYFILPSSIHEVIIVPFSKSLTEPELSEMVEEINRTQVLEEEVLSDHAYFYNVNERRLSYFLY